MAPFPVSDRAARWVLGALVAVAVGLAVAVLLTLSGCGAAQHPDDDPCRWERVSVSAARAATDALEALVPADAPGRAQALDATREALDLGDDALEACEAAHEHAGWAVWVSTALEGLADLLELLKAAGVPVPAAVIVGVQALAGLLPVLGGGA